MRIALLATCIGDTMFPQAPQATFRLLERLGHDVVFPPGQACCGQMHVNTGYFAEAVPVIRNQVAAFEPILDGAWDAVVVPSGSCTGSIRHQQGMIARRAGEADLAERADAIAAKTYELSELLIDVLKVVSVGAYFPHRVTYHPTCHSLRMLRVGDRPLRLLRAVEGIDLVELPSAEACCGFGGTFALKNAPTSAAMLADKIANIRATGARVVTAGDYSCLMHIGGGLSRGRSGIAAMHLAEILASTRESPARPDAALGSERDGRSPARRRVSTPQAASPTASSPTAAGPAARVLP